MIPKETANKIKETADLLSVISDFVPLKKSGSSHIGLCPACGAKKFTVTPGKEIWKCFSGCGVSGTDAASFLMKTQALTYPEALKQLAQKYAIPLEEDEAPRPIKVPKKKGVSFRDLQLKESGIDKKKQMFRLRLNRDTEKEDLCRYESASIDQYWNIVHDGDDMILQYLDLDGTPLTYLKDGKGKPKAFFRIRYKNPHLPENMGKDGKPRKYSQPAKSGTHPWLPNAVIDLYRAKKKFTTLGIIEGEKKADKLVQHELVTVGIGGINNLVFDRTLPKQIGRLVEKGEQKNAIFWVDADWDDLGSSPDKPVDQRAKTFISAIRTFQDYFRAFANQGIHLNLYFGYIRKEHGVKGHDDLLAGPLAGKEHELVKDVDWALNDAKGEGKYIQLHNITDRTHYQLKEYWHLESPMAFIQHHKEELKKRGTFQIGRFKWKFNDEGEPEADQPILPNEQYWIKEEWSDRGGQTREKYLFDPQNIRVFLRNRGFGRLKMSHGKHKLVQLDDHIVREVDTHVIRDFVLDYTEYVIQEKDVLRMLLRAANRYFGPDQLSTMYVRDLDFVKNDAETQYLFFQETYWKISKAGIEENPLSQLPDYVWSEKLKDFKPKILEQPMLRVTGYDKEKHEVQVDVNAEAYAKCDFAQFLERTSDFYWKENDRGQKKPTPEQWKETLMQMIGKMTAIGYLLHRFRDPNVMKAVIGMDGRMSEVGRSQGRSGKSLVGEALLEVLNGFYINGKSFDPDRDPFSFDGIDERTDIVFVDDPRVNFRLEALYGQITGRFEVNPKGAPRFFIPKELTPKIYVATNHAPGGRDGSDLDRQLLVGFSDYFNKDHKPMHEFEDRFFDDWKWEQWNLFYNLMACCLQIYLEHGLITPPLERLEKRRLRHEMGEAFVQWAELFFSPELDNRNKRQEKKALYEAFVDENPQQKRYIDIRRFKERLKLFCEYWSNLSFNPHQDGGDDKTGGKEYCVIADERFDANDIKRGMSSDDERQAAAF